jgi:hypothetical protein
MQPKLIYFAERHPNFDRAGFRVRWRAHGALGMRLPRWRNVLRYTQCDRIDAEFDVPGELGYDGVATVVFRGEAERLAHIADPDGRLTKADEAETFAKPVRDVSALTRPMLMLPHRSGAPMRLFVARRTAPAPDSVSFLAEFGCGHECNLVRPDAPNALKLEVIDEVSIPESIDARAILLRLADASPTENLRWILTQECVLFPPAAAQT